MHIALAELNETVLIQLVVLKVEGRVVFTLEANGKVNEVYDSGRSGNRPSRHEVRILNGYLGRGVNTLKWSLDNETRRENGSDAWELSFKVVARRLFKNAGHDEVELESWEMHGHGGAANVWSDYLTLLY